MSQSTTTGVGRYEYPPKDDDDSANSSISSSISSTSRRDHPHLPRATASASTSSIFSWRQQQGPPPQRSSRLVDEDHTSTSGVDWDCFLREEQDDGGLLFGSAAVGGADSGNSSGRAASPSSGDEAPDIPRVGSGLYSTTTSIHNTSTTSQPSTTHDAVSLPSVAGVEGFAEGVNVTSSYSFSDEEFDQRVAEEDIHRLNRAYRQFEQMVEQQQPRFDPSPVPNEMLDDDRLSHELLDLEHSERELRHELQKISSKDAEESTNSVRSLVQSHSDGGDSSRPNELGSVFRGTSLSIGTGDMPSSSPSNSNNNNNADHPDIAAGPPSTPKNTSSPSAAATAAANAAASSVVAQPSPPRRVENPFDIYLESNKPKFQDFQNIYRKASSNSPMPQPDTVSTTGTDTSLNTVAFLEKYPPTGRQRVPSDGDEQLTIQTRAEDHLTTEDDAESSDGLTTANRGVPLQFDPDTYSYDAEVDAILHHHNQQDHPEQPPLVQSELQDIDERTGSAAYTTTTTTSDEEEDESSVDDHSNAMRVAPPYLMVAPPRTYADESNDLVNNNTVTSVANTLGLRSHTTLSYVSELSSSQSSETHTSTDSHGSSVSNSSVMSGTSTTDGEEAGLTGGGGSIRRMLAAPVISPAVKALSLAHGGTTCSAASGEDPIVVVSQLRRSRDEDSNKRTNEQEEKMDDDSVSALAATATPLDMGETSAVAAVARNSMNDDKEDKASVHSFSVGTASSEASMADSQEDRVADLAKVDPSIDEELGSNAYSVNDDLVSTGNRTVPHSNKSKEKLEESERTSRKRRCTCCSGISGKDRFKFLIAVLMWAGLAALVYFLVTWSIQENDSNESNNIEVVDDETPSDELQTPPVAPPVALPTAAPTSTADSLFQLLAGASFDDGDALLQEGSPQNQAFNWLAYSNANFTAYSDAKKLTRYALATFYWSTGGNETWVDDTLWLSDSDECDWFTRSRSSPCNFEGGFKDLEVSYNNLEGVLPPELAFLSDTLITINIGGGPNNAIGGTLPKELGYLSKLEELRLASNNLAGNLPAELGGWKSIRTIDLSGNRLGGLLPEEIGSMTDLYSLNAEDNALSGPLPTTIGKLVHLKTLSLSQNQLTSVPTEIGSLIDLVFLELQENDFEGPLPTEIGQLVGLRQMTLNDNMFSGTMPTELSLLPGLATLDLSYNAFTGLLPPFGLLLLNQMRDLRLSHNLLAGPVPTSFANLTGVQTLLLQENNLEGVMPTIVCSVFSVTFPTVFVDCMELECPCCNFCCTDEIGCVCQFVNSTAEWQCF